MGDLEYEKNYMNRKKQLRALHKRLYETKETQEIYHRIMGSDVTSGDEPEQTEDLDL